MISRRHFLAESALVTSLGALAGRALGQDAPPPKPEPPRAETPKPAGPPAEFRLLSAPVLTNPAADGMTVVWAASAAATGWVEYGETPELGQKATGTAGGLMPYDERCFKIRLRGLKPGVRYHYRVHAVRMDFQSAYKIFRKEEVRTEVHSFVTPNPAAESVRFMVWNDTHENLETLRALHAAQEKTPGDFMLWNGDQTNDLYSEEKMVGQFLAPAGLPYAASVPYYYVRGNHDVRGPAARHLARFTDVAEGQYYYAFRQGPLAALVLDTGEDKPDDAGVYGGLNDFAAWRTQQVEWLAQAIEKREFQSAPFKVLFCHIPLRWKNEQRAGEWCADGRRKWHDLLVKAGIKTVISGHTHQSFWMPADESIPYGQVTGGGPKPAIATYLRGEVTKDLMKLTQYHLDGRVQYEMEWKA